MENKYNQLLSRKNELEEDTVKIKLKLDEAKAKFYATGIMSNSNWFYKAKYALEMKKLELKKINLEMEQLKRNMKTNRKSENDIKTRTFERTFMNISNLVLSEEDYSKILNLTRESINKTVDVEEKEKLNTVKSIKWSKADEEYLEQSYKNTTIRELMIILNRSENSVRSKIYTIKKRK